MLCILRWNSWPIIIFFHGCTHGSHDYNFTSCGISQLPTNNGGICTAPAIIANRSPDIAHADLHPSFVGNTSANQSQLPISTGSCGKIPL